MPKKKSSAGIKTVLAPATGINQNDPKNLIKDTDWSDGNNVRFGVGYVEKVGGWEKFITNQLSGEVLAVDNYYKYNGDSYLIFITTTNVYVYDPINHTVSDITGTTPLNGSLDHPVFSENAQNYFVFTNGVDPVKYWTGTGNIADLPGLNDCVPWNDGTPVTSVIAKSLVYFANFLLLFGTVENGIAYPQRMRWSSLGDITTWKNADAYGQAGWADFTDGVDWAQCLVPLGNYLVAYKERSVQVVTYVGGDTIWDKWPSIQGTGLIAPKAIFSLGDEHIFVGNNNVHSFDLRDVKIAGDDIAKELFMILDPGNTVRMNNFYFEEIPEGGFNFVSTNSADDYPDKAIVYNTDTKSWSWRDMPMISFGYYNATSDADFDSDEDTWDSVNDEWNTSKSLLNAPINLSADQNGYVYVFDGHSKDGADLPCYIRTKLFDFDNPMALKRAKRIQFMISREGQYNLQVRVGTAANVDEPITWETTTYMSLDKTTPPWVDIDVTARYMIFEFATLLKDQPFRITGYIISYETRGAI